MLLIWDGPGRSVLLKNLCVVRSASGMVRDGLGGPGSSMLTPCWVQVGPGRCRGGPGSSVFIRNAAVLGPV